MASDVVIAALSGLAGSVLTFTGVVWSQLHGDRRGNIERNRNELLVQLANLSSQIDDAEATTRRELGALGDEIGAVRDRVASVEGLLSGLMARPDLLRRG